MRYCRLPSSRMRAPEGATAPAVFSSAIEILLRGRFARPLLDILTEGLAHARTRHGARIRSAAVSGSLTHAGCDRSSEPAWSPSWRDVTWRRPGATSPEAA